jgi:alpha-1,6-mannosyltransferase
VSGGLRTAVDALGRGYLAAGHERALVVPGRAYSRRQTEAGLVVTVPGLSVAPGYRFVLDPRPVLRVLDRLGPDVVGVSDKATLAVAARWARRRGVRSVLFSHERLDAILAPRLPDRFPIERALQRATDYWNRRLAGAPATGPGFADGVVEVLGWPEAWRRAGARSRAERYPWSATVAGMLSVHAGPG